MAFVASLSVSSTSSLLSSLRSFLTSTLSWTLIDTGVSGISDNFVVRSLGASGDRHILLKFGVSNETCTSISAWAADGFNSATDATSNPVTEHLLRVNSGASLTVWVEGDQDHLFIGTTGTPGATAACWLYGGLTQEFTPTPSAVPNQAILVNAFDMGGSSGRVVESPTGTYNATLSVDTVGTTFTTKSDPNLLDGLTYLWPILIGPAATDRLLGTLRNLYAVGPGVVHNTVLTASAQDYVVFGSINTGGTSNAGVALRLA